jgi:transposase-like protein
MKQIGVPPMTNDKKSRQYDADFKRNATELYLSSDKTCKEISDDLGISDKTLHAWVQKYRQGGQSSFGPKQLTAHEKEMLALKKQLADITMERDILKKAIAIFSRKK